jgi:hypothetical protein
MSLLDEQVRVYPELLKRMAAGERLASDQGETEKLAATMLVVESIEKEQAAKKAEEKPEIKKEAIVELGIGAALGAALKGPVGRMVRRMRGEPQVPEEAAELLKGFRRIYEAREAERLAKRKVLGAAVGGAGLGVLATKALEKKDKAAATTEETKVADGNGPSARGLLTRIMKNFQ